MKPGDVHRFSMVMLVYQRVNQLNRYQVIMGIDEHILGNLLLVETAKVLNSIGFHH